MVITKNPTNRPSNFKLNPLDRPVRSLARRDSSRPSGERLVPRRGDNLDRLLDLLDEARQDGAAHRSEDEPYRALLATLRSA